MNNQVNQSKPPKTSLLIGGFILVVGFLSPLLIPLILSTDWSDGLKSVVTGLLAFGIPELFMILAVAVMGKQGYQFLKEKFLRWIKRISPDRISIQRHRFGIVLFSIPLILGFIKPYLAFYIPQLDQVPLVATVGMDIILLTSLFVLGGEFWEKLKGLFLYNVIAIKRQVNIG